MKTAATIEKLARLASREHMADRGFQLRLLNPHLNDLIGVLTGVKPVLLCAVPRKDRAYILALAEYFGLQCSFPVKERGQFYFGKNMLDVLLSRDREPLEAAEELWECGLDRGDSSEQEWGGLLGYPACCVKQYLNWRRRQSAKPAWDKERAVRNTYGNTPRKKRLPFLLNNLFLYQSSLDSETREPEEREKMKALLSRNRREFGIDLMNMSVISWHPCSYSCTASLRKAKTIYRVMKKCLPGLAASLKNILSRPVIFLDRFEFLVLDGGRAAEKKSGTEITFSRIIPPLSLIPAETAGVLGGLKQARVRRDSLAGPDGTPLLRAPAGQPVLFMDFSG
ncbi:MAG TPA: hypothetical protein PKI19_10060 [Elusimicrobiales bacterium]|nr:hypothetical protein [Elusimicrobiales bacterium]